MKYHELSRRMLHCYPYEAIYSDEADVGISFLEKDDGMMVKMIDKLPHLDRLNQEHTHTEMTLLPSK